MYSTQPLSSLLSHMDIIVSVSISHIHQSVGKRALSQEFIMCNCVGVHK